MFRPFRDRAEAGRQLAGKLVAYAGRPDVLVLALPRGGVPVGYEVAQALEAPLDVFVVRKLGLPGHEELAMGAIASGGVMVFNEDVIQSLNPPIRMVEAVATRELQELGRRERAYRGDRAALEVEGRTVILVDDGLATGSTMRAAVKALRRLEPARIVVAVPTGAPAACAELGLEADECICGIRPDPFLPSGSGTRISPRPPTTRFVTSSNGRPSGRWSQQPNDRESIAMRAMVLNALDLLMDNPAPLRLSHLPAPVPAEGELLIEVHTCGVCHTELDEIEGRTPPPQLPIVLGHQVVGCVAALGAGAGSFRPGDRIGVAWIFSACGRCSFCLRGEENLCEQFRATGRDVNGGYAELMTVPEAFAHRIPENFSDAEAAPLLCAARSAIGRCN